MWLSSIDEPSSDTPAVAHRTWVTRPCSAVIRDGSLTGTWCTVPPYSYMPLASRFGQGASTMPENAGAISASSYGWTTSTPPTR